MSKITFLYSLLGGLFLFPSVVFADMGDESTLGAIDSSGSNRIRIDSSGNFFPGADSTYDLGKTGARWKDAYFDAVHTQDAKYVYASIGDLILETPADITASTTPGLEVDNGAISLVWADGETTKAIWTVRLPPDYESSAAFEVVASVSAVSGGDNRISWAIYENGIGDAWDTTRWQDVPVVVEGSTTPDLVELSRATLMATFVAGDLITVEVWRDNSAGTGTGDLEIYGLWLKYTN